MVNIRGRIYLPISPGENYSSFYLSLPTGRIARRICQSIRCCLHIFTPPSSLSRDHTIWLPRHFTTCAAENLVPLPSALLTNNGGNTRHHPASSSSLCAAQKKKESFFVRPHRRNNSNTEKRPGKNCNKEKEMFEKFFPFLYCFYHQRN